MISKPTALFRSFAPNGGWNYSFSNPCEIREGRDLASVHEILHFAEAESNAGRWVVLALAYEAAPAFDPALKVHTSERVHLDAADDCWRRGHLAPRPGRGRPGSIPQAQAVESAAVSSPPPSEAIPLMWAASFRHPDPAPRRADFPVRHSSEAGANTPWQPALSRQEYSAAIARIRTLIAQGDTYQVNYTFPLHAHLKGDSLAWFDRLGPAQGAGYSAWLELGPIHLLSFSPELFFERRGDHIVTRPMKGTLPRGRFLREDEAQAETLRNSPKNRAENVMIVDMLRNDLGKVAVPGTVQTTRLFDVEKYRMLFQMTSTVEAQLQPGVGLTGILTALFPCASVTGAPKVRTMEIIRELEPVPRGLYTGAIGVVQPNGDALFNVAIRTITLDTETGAASCHVGGGITWDSTEEDEYQECLHKAAFLSAPPPSFDLLESLLLENGAYFLLDGHLARLKDSATYFDFPYPEEGILARLESLRQAHPTGAWKVRLLMNVHGQLKAEAQPAPESVPVKLALARSPIDSKDRMFFHKTTRRDLYEQALAACPGAGDVLLWNERGELTESTRANLVLELDGLRYTPPLECGLLPGVFREELLKTGVLRERVLRREDLARAQNVYLINSVRQWIPAQCI